MFGLKQKDIDAINSCFARHEGVKQVILYGSRAKGDFREGSDIDLTIIDSGMNGSDLARIENELDDLFLPYKIDLSFRRQIDNSDLLSHIDRVGKIFYTKEDGAE
jgi:predicted nucleotidyltransferase